MLSSSSTDDSDEPSLELLKSSRLQCKVDKRLRDLSQSSHSARKLKYKSKRGGDIDVKVRHRVHWPDEAILGEINRQRVGYDQLSLTQWIRGFCRNVLEEKSESRKDIMISYLGDLMEYTTDFWQGAKAAHAVLLCEMERGSLRWEDTERIDRVHGLMPKNMSLQVDKIGLGQTKSPGCVRALNRMHIPIRKVMR